MSPSSHDHHKEEGRQVPISKSLEGMKRKDLTESKLFTESLYFGLTVAAPVGGFYGFSQSFWIGAGLKPLLQNTIVKTGAFGMLVVELIGCVRNSLR